jgi:hypothetical protein
MFYSIKSAGGPIVVTMGITEDDSNALSNAGNNEPDRVKPERDTSSVRAGHSVV